MSRTTIIPAAATWRDKKETIDSVEHVMISTHLTNLSQGTSRNVNRTIENDRRNKAFNYTSQSNRQDNARHQLGRCTSEEQWNLNTIATKQRPQLSHGNSITEEIVENFPTPVHRTLSNNFLPRSRPPNNRN